MVDVNLTTTTTQTTVSCSEYVSAQSLLLGSLDPKDSNNDRLETGGGYRKSFLSSPACTSYAKWTDEKLLRGQAVLSYSNCGNTLSKSPEEYLPFRFENAYPGQYCCGPCAILIDEIRVLYFPEESPAFCSNNSRSTEKAMANHASKLTTIRKRGEPFQANEHSIATSDGQTL